MAQNNDARAAAGFSAATAIAAAILLLRKPAAAAGTIPPEVIQLLVAIAGTSEDTKGIAQQILDALAVGGGQGWPPNTDAITSLRVAIDVTGTQLPYIAIPSGMALVIKAWALNPGWLQVGATQSECTQVNQSFPLLPNEVVTYQVENADKIYIGATAAGCFACLTVEQRRMGGG